MGRHMPLDVFEEHQFCFSAPRWGRKLFASALGVITQSHDTLAFLKSILTHVRKLGCNILPASRLSDHTPHVRCICREVLLQANALFCMLDLSA